MRLCFLSQEDVVKPQGGTGTYVRNMSLALAARQHEVHVITRQYEGSAAFEQVEGVSVHRIAAPGPPVLYSPLYFWQARRKFLELSRAAPFEAIHGNMPLMSSWGVRAAGLPPIVETVHCTVREELRSLAFTSMRTLNFNEILVRVIAPTWLTRERYLLRRARRVIAVSQGLKRELVEQNHCPAENIAVIPNGIDYARFANGASLEQGTALRQQLGIGTEERIILYLGRLMERKRVVDLVQALPQVQARIPQARLVVVGRRNRNADLIEQMARSLGVASHVTLIDHVSYRDVPAYYAMADVYALPSAYEGFPFTILEAMASGTPVVASQIPGIDEQVMPGETGLLHPVGDIHQLAENLIGVLADQSLAVRLAAAAQKVVEQNYDWNVIGARTEQVFQSAVAG